MVTRTARSKDLLTAVKQMPAEEFDAFLDQVLQARQQTAAATLSPAETKLIKRINRGLPLALSERYGQLIERRETGMLTKGEHQELLELTHEVESRDSDRAAALVALANLRRLPVRTLMKQLKIQVPPIRG